MPGHKQVARNYQQNFQPSASTKCFAKQPESVRVWLLLGNLDPDIIKDLIWINIAEQANLRQATVATINILMDLFLHYQEINEQLLFL
jgi:hypothetical protein